MEIVNAFFSVILTVLASTALLVEKFDYKKMIILTAYVGLMSVAAIYYGTTASIPSLLGVMVLVFVLSDEFRVLNACIAYIGCLISTTCKNGCYMLAIDVADVSIAEFAKRYGIIFNILYLVFLWILLKGLRYIIYKMLHMVIHLNHISRPVRKALLGNLFLFIIVFCINVFVGQNTGNSTEILLFSGVLFIVCMLSSTLLIWVCTSSVEVIQQEKAEQRQREITENYIESMEHVLDELRAFKHDYKNIMAEMAGYIREGQIEALKEYYYKVMEKEEGDRYKDLYIWKYLRNIQPTELKGLLYEKAIYLLNKEINLDIRIDDNLNVSYGDMQVINRILGVFIDNAFEAAVESKEKVVIIQATSVEGGTLFVISNSYSESPELGKIFQKGYSTKGKERGMGLYWVQKVLKKKEELIYEISIKDGMVIQSLNIPED